MYRVVRFSTNPLVHAGMNRRIGTNINGPSVIRVPDWISGPLGRYYLYFAHHKGKYIRMAHADDLRGPWTILKGGVLGLENTACRKHIASPEVHIRPSTREIVMYFHGCTTEGQRTFRGVSPDGLSFRASSEPLGPFYFRLFEHDTAWFAIAKAPDAKGGGVLLRSPDGIRRFERGSDILPNQRHVAVRKRGDILEIFFSRGEDCPERILVSTMRLAGDWRSWAPSPPVEVLRPEMEYEGALLPLRASSFGASRHRVRELRDPAIYEEDGRLFLYYTGAGENNICGAELFEDETK